MIYKYNCPNCNKTEDVEHTIKECDTKIVICSGCGTKMYRLILGGTGFTLEGQGWSKDGYSTKKG